MDEIYGRGISSDEIDGGRSLDKEHSIRFCDWSRSGIPDLDPGSTFIRRRLIGESLNPLTVWLWVLSGCVYLPEPRRHYCVLKHSYFPSVSHRSPVKSSYLETSFPCAVYHSINFLCLSNPPSPEPGAASVDKPAGRPPIGPSYENDVADWLATLPLNLFRLSRHVDNNVAIV